MTNPTPNLFQALEAKIAFQKRKLHQLKFAQQPEIAAQLEPHIHIVVEALLEVTEEKLEALYEEQRKQAEEVGGKILTGRMVNAPECRISLESEGKVSTFHYHENCRCSASAKEANASILEQQYFADTQVKARIYLSPLTLLHMEENNA